MSRAKKLLPGFLANFKLALAEARPGFKFMVHKDLEPVNDSVMNLVQKIQQKNTAHVILKTAKTMKIIERFQSSVSAKYDQTDAQSAQFAQSAHERNHEPVIAEEESQPAAKYMSLHFQSEVDGIVILDDITFNFNFEAPVRKLRMDLEQKRECMICLEDEFGDKNFIDCQQCNGVMCMQCFNSVVLKWAEDKLANTRDKKIAIECSLCREVFVNSSQIKNMIGSELLLGSALEVGFPKNEANARLKREGLITGALISETSNKYALNLVLCLFVAHNKQGMLSDAEQRCSIDELKALADKYKVKLKFPQQELDDAIIAKFKDVYLGD